jgi:glycyl-tRNA synthetase beta chain
MEFLIEINVEEMPVSHVRPALDDLREKFKRELAAANIPVKDLRTFSTCRRLVIFADLAGGQEDREALVTGPPKAAAFAPDGTPTAATLGFARSKGIDIGQLEVIKTERGEYIGFRKIEKGKSAADILGRIIPQTLGTLSFPKMMRWGEGQFRFSRPVRNIFCLLGGASLTFEMDGLVSRDSTTGHKIHAPEEIRPKTFQEYQGTLREKMVIVDAEERKKIILNQVDALLAPLKAQLYPDSELLEKLCNDVEYPYVFIGSFPEQYLTLPLEILSTAMREGQKLFSIVKGRKQIPHFLGVADAPADAKGFIQAGNERVLKARLEDAKFFWEQDTKTGLKKRAPALKHVLFQEKLGTYDDKVQRLRKIVSYICHKVEESDIEKDVVQAAELCKADLVTDMVREFPSLQGRVGGLYVKAEGLPATVAQTIYEHYQPVSLEDEPPSSMGGAILSIADKMDSVVGVIGIGVQTTGSSDPFGLRRNAQGVCKIILDKKLNFSFPRLLEKVLSVYGDKIKRPKEEILRLCLEFFLGRLRSIYERMGFRYDLINASLGTGLDNMYHSYLRLKALDGLKTSPQFEPFILMAKRVNNILTGQPAGSLNADAFVEKDERELFATFSIVKENAIPMIAKGDFGQAQKMVFRLQPCLNNFFDHVLVMTDDSRLRKNRLALLHAISKILGQMADYSQVVVEGEKPGDKK